LLLFLEHFYLKYPAPRRKTAPGTGESGKFALLQKFHYLKEARGNAFLNAPVPKPGGFWDRLKCRFSLNSTMPRRIFQIFTREIHGHSAENTAKLTRKAPNLHHYHKIWYIL
jgi:hypothetical protein